MVVQSAPSPTRSPPPKISKEAAPSAHGDPHRAQVLAQDPCALKETNRSSNRLDTTIEHQARKAKETQSSAKQDQDSSDHAEDQDESDEDSDDHGDSSSSWWLDPSIPASNTISACLNLIHTSEQSALSVASSIPHILNACYHLFILIPSAVFLAILSHIFLPRGLWQRGGAPRRLSWPVRRSHNWTVRETISVAVVSHLLPAFMSVSKTRFCPSAERLIPALSRSLFGVKHQGWTIEGVAVQLREDEQCKISLPYQPHGEPSSSSGPTPVLLWKSFARNVSHHQITSFKPSISCGGIGGGAAQSKSERVLLLLSGSSYIDRDPVAGLLACNLVNLTGLRCLCVNWRRPSSNDPKGSGQRGFPAGLNDALQAYAHLTRVMKVRPENVYLVGEGSGAGVAMGLMTWLSALQLRRDTLQQQGSKDPLPPAYGKPGKVALWSPWCDLTMQSPTWRQNESFDIISCKEATAARDAYISSLGLANDAGTKQSSSSRSSPVLTHTIPRAIDRKHSSQGSDSGLEIDSRPASPAPPPSFLSAPISTFMGAVSIDKGNSDSALTSPDEPTSVWSMGASVDAMSDIDDVLAGKSKDQIQQHLAKQLDKSPASAPSILMSSLSSLGLEHPLLSPGLPFSNGDTERPFNERIIRLLHRPTPSASSRSRSRPAIQALPKATRTKYLIFCGRDSVIWGEAASLTNNLTQVEEDASSDSPSSHVAFLASLDTPTMFNLLPSVFLPQAQARADGLLKTWLIGDVEE